MLSAQIVCPLQEHNTVKEKKTHSSLTWENLWAWWDVKKMIRDYIWYRNDFPECCRSRLLLSSSVDRTHLHQVFHWCDATPTTSWANKLTGSCDEWPQWNHAEGLFRSKTCSGNDSAWTAGFKRPSLEREGIDQVNCLFELHPCPWWEGLLYPFYQFVTRSIRYCLYECWS